MIEQHRLTPNGNPRPLSQKAARSLVLKVNQCAQDAKQYLLELHDREGWRVLGYKSFKDFVENEITLTRQQTYNLLNSAEINAQLSNIFDTPIIDTHACVLKRVAEERREAVYTEALQSVASGKLTAKKLKEVAEDLDALPPKWGDRGKEKSADWGRGKSGRYEIKEKLAAFTGEQKYLFLLKCAEQLGHSARWEIASEVEKVKDTASVITATAQKIDFTY